MNSFQKPFPSWVLLSFRTTHFTCSLLKKVEPDVPAFCEMNLENRSITIYCYALLQLQQFSIEIILHRGTFEWRLLKMHPLSAGEEEIGNRKHKKILCSRKEKNMSGLVAGRWGSHKELVLMSEGQVFRLITFVVCPAYCSCSSLLSVDPCKGRGSDLLRMMDFTFFFLFLSSLHLSLFHHFSVYFVVTLFLSSHFQLLLWHSETIPQM